MKSPKIAITHLAIEIDTQVTHHVVGMETRGSQMPQKAGCAGRNKISNCCNYIWKRRKEMLGYPVKVNV